MIAGCACGPGMVGGAFQHQGLAQPTATPFQFVAVGDMPYSPQESALLSGEIKEAITAAQVPFLVHYGDFKPGNQSCTDPLLQQSRDQIYGLHAQVWFTPGDNDWTDCDRQGLAEPKSELDRLDYLRQIFFSPTVGLSSKGEIQIDQPENARWWHQNVLFVTLHVVGTSNGRTQILKDDPEQAMAAVDLRDQRNQHWLQDSFAEATSQQAAAVVVVMQADITQPAAEADCSSTPRVCDAYEPYRHQLVQAAAQFRNPDQRLKPVLLLHGDTFPYCWDKTFGADIAPNLWRLNAWGDFQQPADVTLIQVQPQDSEQPFVAKTLSHQIQPALTCSARF
ncbi:hypothetical protein [Lyngbya confervoides]|uniref:Calcineurin-like phosphoesterase domain-containing protein n=1 Tax=Lyngbya confervoides BDU141951 TaxID=1574623 RepID=A0ABD4T8I7_9CYAN|nr:hypothetical protein [Lyngbya confervoides]MCM1984808.1 hypothetical protein [Lyngbya confervoides BDU141951]